MSRAGHLGYDSTTAELIILHADRGSGFSANGDVVVDWEGELVEATFINDPARARAFFKWLDANGIESLVNATVEEGKALWAYVRKANEEAVRKHLVDGGCACVDCMNTRLHDLLNTIDPTPATMADLDNAAFGNILDCMLAYRSGGDDGLRAHVEALKASVCHDRSDSASAEPKGVATP